VPSALSNKALTYHDGIQILCDFLFILNNAEKGNTEVQGKNKAFSSLKSKLTYSAST
jgi:hypothetical protein